jgi:enhancing lycopene biosynthesis protein 2
MVYLTNAFSINMLNRSSHVISFIPLTEDETRALLSHGFVSAVGHQDTANVLTDLLGISIPCERRNVVLDEGDKLVVAQYTGPRLPEGATKLPEGAEITFWLVQISRKAAGLS